MLGSEYTWIWLALIIFLGLVAWKGLKPILAALDARADKIRSELEEAQALREEAQKRLAEAKRKQRDAVKAAEEIVEHAKKEAEIMRKQAEADLKESLARREQLSLAKIEQAEANAMAEVRGKAVDTAIAAARDLIAEGMNKTKANALLKDSIDDVANKLN